MKFKICQPKIPVSNHLVILVLVCFSVVFSCKEKNNYETVAKKESVFLSGKLIPDDHFLGDQNCRECHEEEFKDWQGSHHDKAMEIADSISVLADFNGEKFTSQGVTSHFFQKNGDFYANTEGPDGEYHDYKVIYTFGVTPLQQYIVQFPDGHYQCLRTA